MMIEVVDAPRPYHTVLTSSSGGYQTWQCRIMYHHWKLQKSRDPCGEMGGFTRLLTSHTERFDGLENEIPTVVVKEAASMGYVVVNRPHSMVQFLAHPRFKERIVEEYVYIAETDLLLLVDIPNRATPKVNVAFFFPYMSPVPTEQANVVKRYYDGNHLSVQPVGPSPAIVHVDNLKKLTPLWYDLSVELKHDNVADRTFGWVLEMWGYSIACARVGVKHYVWQQLQIEPSATWHQNVSAEDPYIYHYTFGVEYSADGIPMVGTVGEWSLDKRHYFGSPPPRELDAPPACAQECARARARTRSQTRAHARTLARAHARARGHARARTRARARARSHAGARARSSTRSRRSPAAATTTASSGPRRVAASTRWSA